MNVKEPALARESARALITHAAVKNAAAPARAAVDLVQNRLVWSSVYYCYGYGIWVVMITVLFM